MLSRRPPWLLHLLAACLLFPPAAAIFAAEGHRLTRTPWRLQLGERMFPVRGTTRGGEPVIHMWSARLYREDLPGGGLPVAEGAQHHIVWAPASRADGAFNHHAALGWHGGRFHAMWSNHPFGEDASGQRVLYSHSAASGIWSKPEELFPKPDDVRTRGESGLALKPDRWWSVGGRWFAVAYLGARNLPEYGHHPIAREVHPDGSLGPVFFLRPAPDRKPGFKTTDVGDPQVTGMPSALLNRYVETGTVSWWAQREGLPPQGAGGASLIEPFTYSAADGTRLLLMRFFGGSYNNRLYVSVASDEGWSTPRPTDIPDSPSRSEAVRVSSGAVLLIGNQIAPYFDRRIYWDRDPLTVAVSSDGLVFDRVFTLRAGAPRQWRFPGIDARNLGFAYPSSLVRDDTLFVLYSIGKEDIGITEVPLKSLGL